MTFGATFGGNPLGWHGAPGQLAPALLPGRACPSYSPAVPQAS